MTCGFSQSEKSRVRYVLQREWRPHLSSDERDFLQYVIEHSIECGRDVLDVTIDQMINGVPADPCTGWSWRLTPVGFARRTLERLIQRLKEKGVLLVEAVRNRCTLIRLNFLWSPMEGIMKIAVPKRLQSGGDRTQASFPFEDEITANLADITGAGAEITANLAANNRHRGGPIEVINTKTNTPSGPLRSPEDSLPVPRKRTRIPAAPESEKIECLSPAKTPDESVRDTVARVQATSREHVKAKADKLKSLDAASAYHATFVNAWFETYPNVPVPSWTRDDMFKVRAVLKSRFPMDVEARHQFIDFVTRNWSAIIADRFGWMKKRLPPEMPSIPFMITPAFCSHFLEAFTQRARVENAKRLPAEEREIERLMQSGKSRDEALKMIGERAALSKVAAKETETRRMNGSMVRDAERLRAQAIEERRKAMRDRAEHQARTAAPAGFEELGDMKIDSIELPEIDYSKWN